MPMLWIKYLIITYYTYNQFHYNNALALPSNQNNICSDISKSWISAYVTVCINKNG